MKTYWYVLDLNAVPWRIGPVTAGRGKGKGIYGKVGRDQELFNFQEAVRDELRQQGAVLVEGKVRLVCAFWRKMDEYKTEKSRTARGQEADATNLLKATEDACQGLLFHNDRDNVDVRSVIVEQSMTSKSKVLIRVQVIGSDNDWLDEITEDMPNAVYAELFGSPAMQLEMELNKPKTTVEKEDDEYAHAPVDF